MDSIKFPRFVRTLMLVALAVLAFAPQVVHAQGQQETTQILIGAPAQANLGDKVTLQAVLTDSQGHPISGETISFTAEVTFLGKTGDVVLAQAVTNGSGQAVAEFTDQFSGTNQLSAKFNGDDRYAASSASAPLESVGNQQVYVEHFGVDLPGLTVPPAPFLKNLWPTMIGWPMAAVLLLVWVTYLVAIKHLLRVAALGNTAEDASKSETRRNP